MFFVQQHGCVFLMFDVFSSILSGLLFRLWLLPFSFDFILLSVMFHQQTHSSSSTIKVSDFVLFLIFYMAFVRFGCFAFWFWHWCDFIIILIFVFFFVGKKGRNSPKLIFFSKIKFGVVWSNSCLFGPNGFPLLAEIGMKGEHLTEMFVRIVIFVLLLFPVCEYHLVTRAVVHWFT